MRLSDIEHNLYLTNITPDVSNENANDISRAYVSDLLSDVLGNAPSGGILITVQVHLNVVAVAVHAGQQAIIFAMGRIPDEATRLKAKEEGIVLFTSPLPAFDIAGQLYSHGIRGSE